MTIEQLVPVIMIIMGLVNAWLIWLATESKKERIALDEKIETIQGDLKTFELKVTQEYVRTSDLKEIRDQITAGIDRLADRIDRLVELKTAQKG
jgi:hypothetical protein